jgi:hypothetical protein
MMYLFILLGNIKWFIYFLSQFYSLDLRQWSLFWLHKQLHHSCPGKTPPDEVDIWWDEVTSSTCRWDEGSVVL